MPIVPAGTLNTTALVVPDLYVQIVPPAVATLNGVPTNILGMVGTASWGPVNKPVIVGSMSDYAANFGPIVNRTNDLGTSLAIAVLQGANNFRCVRVTDGTDVAATGKFGATTADITFTALYTGSLGNQITVSLAAGGAASSWTVTIGIPGYQPEVFTNITGSGATFWSNLANAINNGQGALRGPSQIITATAGTGTDTPTAESVTLAGGTDGASSVTAQDVVGTDVSPRTGMYVLRGQGCSVGLLCDVTDTSTWTEQVAFGLGEGIYMISAIAAGTSVSTAVTDVQTAGVDSYALKIMHGDWLYWYDQTNKVYRLVSPAAFAAGRLVNLSPEQSSLNKPLYGIVGSQTYGLPGSSTAHHYASADLQALFSAGIDVITNPIPGGPIWGVRGGINSSLSADVNGDNYTRMTNYIAATLNAGMGTYIGRLITGSLFSSIKATLTGFLNGLLQQGMLGDPTQTPVPFSVKCDTTNNPQNRTALGYVQADTQVQYAGINKFFLVNLQGGQTVTVTPATSP